MCVRVCVGGATLQTELGVFFINIFFRFLEGANASYMQKEIVLDILRKLCGRARFPVDLYLNYDCDFEGTNIFERLIESLSQLAQGSSLTDAIREALLTVEQGHMLQLKALDLLVTCLVSTPPTPKHSTSVSL